MEVHKLLCGIGMIASDLPQELNITGISYDSRTTRPGDLFVAISGYATDGHRYIPMAIERGAAAVLREHDMPKD